MDDEKVFGYWGCLMTLFDTMVNDFSSSLYYIGNGLLVSVNYSLSSINESSSYQLN